MLPYAERETRYLDRIILQRPARHVGGRSGRDRVRSGPRTAGFAASEHQAAERLARRAGNPRQREHRHLPGSVRGESGRGHLHAARVPEEIEARQRNTETRHGRDTRPVESSAGGRQS